MRNLSYCLGILSLFITTASFAQVPAAGGGAAATNSNVPFAWPVPETGDFGIGFNAVPLINIIGNATSGDDKSIKNMFGKYNAVFGKYMLADDRAIRASFAADFTNATYRNFVVDNTANSPDSLVTDFFNESSQSFVIGFGYEKRRMKGRIHGIYGSDLLFSFERNNHTYTYGNAFGLLNPTPTSTNWQTETAQPTNNRVVSQNNGSFGIGLRPFVGIEYFFGPRISIGGEIGYAFKYEVTRDGEMASEFYAPSEDVTITDVKPFAGSRSFSTGAQNFNGAVILMFYF
jgi:hypothetical protein